MGTRTTRIRRTNADFNLLDADDKSCCILQLLNLSKKAFCTLQPFLRTDNQNIKKGKCTKAQNI